jgi:hypothetical protein
MHSSPSLVSWPRAPRNISNSKRAKPVLPFCTSTAARQQQHYKLHRVSCGNGQSWTCAHAIPGQRREAHLSEVDQALSQASSDRTVSIAQLDAGSFKAEATSPYSPTAQYTRPLPTHSDCLPTNSPTGRGQPTALLLLRNTHALAAECWGARQVLQPNYVGYQRDYQHQAGPWACMQAM